MDEQTKRYRESLAFELAWWCHRDQKDKQGASYIQHVTRVAWKFERCSDERTVALLHDTAEDFDMGMIKVIRTLFGAVIAEAVDLLTRHWGDSYLVHYIPRIVASGNPLAINVKIADLEDHLDPCRVTVLTSPERSFYREALKLLREAKERLSAPQCPAVESCPCGDIKDRLEALEKKILDVVPQRPADPPKPKYRNQIGRVIDTTFGGDVQVEFGDGVRWWFYCNDVKPYHRAEYAGLV